MVRKAKRSATARRRAGLLHHYFVPGAHNSHQPRYLRLEETLAQLALIVLLFFIMLGVEQLVIRSPSPQVGAVVASVLVELANDDRIKNGTVAYTVNPLLEKAAQMKADDMAAKGYFDHISPEGVEPWHWFREAGYEFRSAGENLAVYFSDSAEVEEAWMASPMHRANILSDRYTEIGIALAHGSFEGNETTFVVQMFGTPAETAAPIVETTPSIGEGADVAGASAEAAPIGAIKSPPSAAWRFLSAPRTMLGYIYMALGGLVVLSLLLLLFVEFKKLHLPSFMRGATVLAVIVILISSGLPFFLGELRIL